MSPSIFIDLLKGKGFCFRIKTKGHEMNGQWSQWLIQPSPSYFETEQDGPVVLRDMEWIEIKPKKDGSKAGEVEFENVIRELTLQNIAVEIQDGFIKVFIPF